MSSKKLKKTASIDDASLNLIIILFAACILIVAITATYFIVTKTAGAGNNTGGGGEDVPAGVTEDYPYKENISVPSFNDESSLIISENAINSDYAIIVDVTSNQVLASRKSKQVIYPASMTKVMTLIVAVENLKNENSLNDIITISTPQGQNSGYGFKEGEKLTVKDLLYAAILQSDGIACIELAKYISGSETNFVSLMNAKAEELGIGETTVFQNCTGLYHKYHYTTCNDMAVMMAYAMKNTLCANVLSSLSYKPSDNFRPGEGCTFWHTLLHNHINDGSIQPKDAKILAGKTGFTEKDTSGHCIVTYAKGDNGHFYVSVTAKADSWAANVDDILHIFNTYAK